MSIDTPGLTGGKKRWRVTVHFIDGREPVAFYAGTIADIDFWHLSRIPHDDIERVDVARIQSAIYNREDAA